MAKAQTTIDRRRLKRVATASIIVKGDSDTDITAACHKILAFVKKIDRFGVVELNINGVKNVKKPAKADESMLD